MVNRTALKTAAKIRMAKAGILRLMGMTIFILLVVNAVSLVLQMRLPEMPSTYDYDALAEYYSRVEDSNILPPVAIVIILIYSLFSSILQVGYKLVCLKVARGEEVRFADMFDTFSYGVKVILLSLLTSLIVTVGTLFFIVPGIILSIIYSQAFYILIEDPSVGVIEALRRSRKLMAGHKAEYFIFTLSYIGWYLFGSLFILAELWVQPYVSVGYALYYDNLTGKQTFHLRRRESGEFEFYAGSSENNPFNKENTEKPEEKPEENTQKPEENEKSGDNNE